MTKSTKIWLIIGAVLSLFGIIMFAGVMTIMKWDLSKLSTVKYITNEYSITEDFSDIEITTDTADIVFIPSESGECRVICHEEENARHSVEVHDNALSVKLSDDKKWYEYIGINSGSPKLTVYLPQGEYGDLTVLGSTGTLKIPSDFSFADASVTMTTGIIEYFADSSKDLTLSATTGSITVKDLVAENTSLSVSTGKVSASAIECTELYVKVSTGKAKIANVNCHTFSSVGNTGDLTLTRVICEKDIIIERSTGDVTLEGCDSGEIRITTDTGDVSGTLLSEKVFIASTDTGRVNVPKTTTGGKCEITTDTGNIEIKIN